MAARQSLVRPSRRRCWLRRSLLLAPVRLWVFVYAPNVILVCPFAEACPRIVLPLWLCFCGSFHTFSAWCGMHDFGMLHRPPWLCYFVLCMALASHRDLPRDWWVLSGPCATLGQWHTVWVSFASWLCYCVTLGSWCKVVRRESVGSFDPCPGWGYSAQPWFSFTVAWCASVRRRIDLCTWWVLRCFSSKSCHLLRHDLSCTCACHGVLHRPPWLCRGVVGKAWVTLGLCATHDPWLVAWISLAFWMRFCATLGPRLVVWLGLAFWMRFCATLGSWCTVVRCEPDRFYVPWWLPHPGVRCQGPLRWLVHAARAYGLGCFGPCHGRGFLAQLWLTFPPKRPAIARPCGRVSIVKDADLPPLSPAPSVASSPPASVSTTAASVPAPAATDAAASVPALLPLLGPQHLLPLWLLGHHTQKLGAAEL
ncbi:hypothetical protein V6N11_021678 [Hibiscus sabdariffa]|uniref:Uncharacterized protein n=1 Tax=Hibiscus sabdariffa TaxID=183260 RepID=A0ABR2TGX2_9ROSI